MFGRDSYVFVSTCWRMGYVGHVDFIPHVMCDCLDVIVKVDLRLDKAKHLKLKFMHVFCK